jgi:hypothetical protein
MVENNKIEVIKEHGRKLDEQLQQLQASTEKHKRNLIESMHSWGRSWRF